MLKIISVITMIILGNLLAFSVIWLILDALFKTDGVFLLVSIILSIPVLGIILYFKMGKYLQQLDTIRNENNGK